MSDDAVAGAMIRAARVAADLTLTELSRRTGIATSTLSLYENSHKQPTVPTLLRVLRAVGTTIEAVPDSRRNAQVLARVCAASMAMPRKHRGDLEFPPFRTLVKHG